jgi:hypothetical protein
MSTLIGQIEETLAGTVALAVAGDEAAFARIIRAHHDDMTRVCFLHQERAGGRRPQRLGRGPGPHGPVPLVGTLGRSRPHGRRPRPRARRPAVAEGHDADVTLDGHPGKYLEWSVPSDMVVTGDADFAGCDTQPSNGHRDFVSWLPSGAGERYQQVAGQVDQLWVLDVDGQRLVVDATYSPNATTADRGELADVAASLRFERP